MIPVRCTCGFSFDAQDAARGKTIDCLECKKPLLIGAETAGPVAQAGRADVERRIGSSSVVVRCMPKFAPVADLLLDFIARSGQPAPRDIFWWGPVPLFLLPEGTDRLRVCEPDLRLTDARSNPRRELSSALATVTMQAAIHEAIGVKIEPFRLLDAVLTFKGATADQRVFLHRKFDPQPVNDFTTDLGWFLGPDPDRWAQTSNRDVDNKRNYSMVRVHELYYERPALVATLGLPMEFIARFEGNAVSHVYDRDHRVVWQPDPSNRLFA